MKHHFREIIFIQIERVSLKKEITPALLRKHQEWNCLDAFLAFIPIRLWQNMVVIVNCNLVINVTPTKKNPIKAATVIELIQFYGISIFD